MNPVEPIEGEPLRFFVKSRRRDIPDHLVDIEENACSCEDHEFHDAPKLARGAIPSPSTRCYHIELARAFFLEQQSREVSARANGQPFPTSRPILRK